jgi:hypothetical protein
LIVLHIGTHKTGTTSLQATLARAGDALAAAGLHYVEGGREGRFAHHPLAWALHGRRKAPMSAWDGVRAELAQHKSAVNILSTEAFWFEDPQSVRDALGEVGAVRVVAYLRRQDEFLQSLYKQSVSSGRKTDFPTWLTQMRRRGDYLATLDAWARVFGDDAITVRPYEQRGRTIDVVRDFLGLVDADADAVLRGQAKGPRNPTPRREVLHFLRAFNQLELDVNHEKLLMRILKRKMKIYVRSIDLLDAEQCAAVMARYADGNRAIAERWLGGAPLFDDTEPPLPAEIWTPDGAEFFELTVDVLQAVVELAGGGIAVKRLKRPKAKTARSGAFP